MAGTDKAAPRRKGAAKARAAVAEKNGTPEPKTAEWRGLRLTLPPSMPGTLYFDFAELELDGSSDMASQVRLLRNLLGDDYQSIKQKIADDRVSMDDMPAVVEDLLDTVFSAYGMGDAGESSASQAS